MYEAFSTLAQDLQRKFRGAAGVRRTQNDLQQIGGFFTSGSAGGAGAALSFRRRQFERDCLISGRVHPKNAANFEFRPDACGKLAPMAD